MNHQETDMPDHPKSARRQRATLALGGAALLALGGAAGAIVMAETRPPVTMAPATPVAIRSLSDGIVTVRAALPRSTATSSRSTTAPAGRSSTPGRRETAARWSRGASPSPSRAGSGAASCMPPSLSGRTERCSRWGRSPGRRRVRPARRTEARAHRPRPHPRRRPWQANHRQGGASPPRPPGF